jgi:DNA-binding NtrC family response regulator
VAAYTISPEPLAAFRVAPYHFDLVITDQTMPHLSGEVLAQAVHRIRLEIPVIPCTGFSHVLTAAKAAALSVQVYLTKPLGTQELSHAIRRVLDQPNKGGAYTHGSYSDH